ncbi:hypothetical protein UA08_05722 [Talaromyces atroroseus]|uniref:Uncharacterized protein n=1 Tax=Talaromyces atroroseus TaxID=1441469 RepID=A0A225AT65_TALAT|nr:hypothetical protein UA08_05722 [Talaromyces atroroseus]OKL58789.1 hypothetical protein UA08_05722 [Talaromyces atroroseus]
MAEEASLLTAPSANLQSNINLQEQCPLFTILPAEIRSLIYTYALTDYEDITHDGQSYDRNTYWYRPGYKARRRTATELLRSCKRVFQETWFMPFALAEHSFYLMHQDRAPPRRVTLERMRQYLATLRDFARIQDGKDIPQIHSIRVFAQLWALEDPRRLQEVLNLEGFRPRNVTITIRYTDFWFWERNAPLHIDARWVNTVIFPESVSTIKMDFEMVDRRKKEIDFITDLAVEKWVFRRADGIIFRANKEDTVTSGWTGSSTWAKARWIRDESRPNEIDFYVKTVTWKPTFDGDNPFAGSYKCPNLDIPSDFVQEPVLWLQGMASVPIDWLASAGVPNEASAEEVAQAVGRRPIRARGQHRPIRRRPRPETDE